MRRPTATPTTLALALCGWLALPPAGGASGDDMPQPEAGQAAVTTLALVQYSRDQCDRIAGRLMSYWQGLGSTPQAQLDAARRFVADKELSSLAASRTAADLVEPLLPAARSEAGTETAASLERLHRMGTSLCNAVTYPDATRQEFAEDLRRILDRIEREEQELGRLLVASEETLASALSPYLMPIQMASIEAEGEYRDYIESLKPPPRVVTRQELMEAWHRRYAEAVRPTKQALAKYLQARRAQDSGQIRTACRELSAAVIPLVQHNEVLKAPEAELYKPLHQAFVELMQMATNCNAGRSREVEEHYAKMQTELTEAATLLAKYSLSP